jgi:hypothetical protein
MGAADSTALMGILMLAVPLHIDELRGCSETERMALARECAQTVTEKGDVILYRSSRKGETARAFNALTKGLAIAAYQPGGVTFGGQHWCTDHQACQRAEQAAKEASGG